MLYEAALFDAVGNGNSEDPGAAYMDRFRVLHSALPNNTRLGLDVLVGAVSMHSLCMCNKDELVPEEVRRRRQERQKEK